MGIAPRARILNFVSYASVGYLVVVVFIFAVLGGQDKPTLSLLIGAILGITASLLSAVGDIKEKKQDLPLEKEKES